MTLLLDGDSSHATGWEGYDYRINYTYQALEKYIDGAWKKVGEVALRYEGSELMMQIPKNLLEINFRQFDFKWADNAGGCEDIMEFIDTGDTAPDLRFNYRYLYKGEQ